MADQKKSKPNKVVWRADLAAPVRLADTFEANDENDTISTLTDRQQEVGITFDSMPNSKKEDNPQEASTPPDHPSPLAEALTKSDSPNGGKKKQLSKPGWKQRKEGRLVRVAAVDDEIVPHDACLPLNQYESTIRRRAVRKRGEVPLKGESPPTRRGLFGTPSSKKIEQKEDVDDVYDEDYGDISLGMKLNIIGGKVIVQGVNPLADGRASPAQLTGVIQRGDVLLSIDGRSLVNMPIVLLVDGLKPLSSPQSTGAYKRVLNLRLAIGEGLSLLEKNEKLATKNAGSEMFSLANFMPTNLPMVDQLSGQPLFVTEMEALKSTQQYPSPFDFAGALTCKPLDANAIECDIYSVDSQISRGLADRRQEEQQRFISEFFAWNDENSDLLKPTVAMIANDTEVDGGYHSKSQLMTKGLQVMKGAKALSYSMEDIDKGKDLRSFKAWSTTLSLRSRASTRRRFAFDSAYMVGSTINEGDSEMASVGSSAHGELDEVNPDRLLIQLAASDEIWRKQVIEAIKQSTKEMEEEKDDTPPNLPDLDLGSLFLGEQVNQLLKKNKKSYALPPEEVTSVLFDLVTNIASTTPDEISVKGGFNINPHSTLVPFEKQKKNVDIDTLLAIRFVIGDVFPVWLKSFKALPWEERRVLWPHTRASAAESHAGATFAVSVDDGLTLDSGSTGYPSPSVRQRKKDLRETIEDMELDEESRSETCFLVTFYFTQEILPKLIGSADRKSGESEVTAALAFVDKFGSYLRLPMCLAYAAYVYSQEVVLKLLSLANHDIRHRDALKETSKTHSFILYEATMLSAIMKQLQSIARESRAEVRNHVIHLCVSSYPDLRPWQVRLACLANDDATKVDPMMAELFYQYLCLLLHPTEGIEMAKQDSELVKMWCELSISPVPETPNNKGAQLNSQRRRENFYRVAKRSWPDHRLYHRDLDMLLDVSIKGREYDLVLELVDEVLNRLSPTGLREKILIVLSHLRTVAEQSLHLVDGNDPLNSERLTLIFHLLEKMAATQRSGVVVADELYEFLRMCATQGDHISNKERSLLALLSNETNPVNAMDVYARWTPDHMSAPDVLPCLFNTLKRATRLGANREISGSLLRIDHERSQVGYKQAPARRDVESNEKEEEHYLAMGDDFIWLRMLNGSLSIEK